MHAHRGNEVAALVAAILACAAVSSSPAEQPFAARSSVLQLALGDAEIVAARLSTGTTSVELRVPPGVASFEMLSCFGADFVARSGGDLPVAIDPCDGMERGSLLHIQGNGGNGTSLKQVHAPSDTHSPNPSPQPQELTPQHMNGRSPECFSVAPFTQLWVRSLPPQGSLNPWRPRT